MNTANPHHETLCEMQQTGLKWGLVFHDGYMKHHYTVCRYQIVVSCGDLLQGGLWQLVFCTCMKIFTTYFNHNANQKKIKTAFIDCYCRQHMYNKDLSTRTTLKSIESDLKHYWLPKPALPATCINNLPWWEHFHTPWCVLYRRSTIAYKQKIDQWRGRSGLCIWFDPKTIFIIQTEQLLFQCSDETRVSPELCSGEI